MEFRSERQPDRLLNETQINTVGPRGEHYSGTWDIKNYDTNGNFLNEQKGTLHATRLTVQ